MFRRFISILALVSLSVLLRATETYTETLTDSPSPTETDVVTETETPTITETATPSITETESPTITETLTNAASATRTRTYTRTASPTPTPSITMAVPTPVACPKVVMSFYPYWTRAAMPASALPYTKLTHIAHAFIRPLADGSLDVPGSYLDPAMNTLAHANGVKVLVSVGGADDQPGGGSEFFDEMILSPAARTTFIDNLTAFLVANDYDGMDIDWEFADSAGDKLALNQFATELRAKFNSSPTTQNFLITIDVSWGNYYGQWVDVAYLQYYLDYINLMFYDRHGAWESKSGHNAGLYKSLLPGGLPYTNYNSNINVNYFLAKGLNPAKILFGMPAYGYKYGDGENLYQSFTPALASSRDYRNIVPFVTGATPGWTRYWDEEAASPYLREDAGAGVISYDDPQSIWIKTQYAVGTRGLAGVFFWDLNGDRIGSSHDLLDAAWSAAQCPVGTKTSTVTPSESATHTLSPSPTATPTLTHSFSPSPSPLITATISPSASATATPVPGSGPNQVLDVAAVPNPNPLALSVLLGGPSDIVTVRVYTTGMQVVGRWDYGPLNKGWNSLPLNADWLASAPSGLYYCLVDSVRGGIKASQRGRSKLVLLR